MDSLYGAVEAGGTKFVCAVGTGPHDLRETVTFWTREPAGTIREALDFFTACQKKYGQLSAIGVASFGPVDLLPSSPEYGWITSTPKPGWRNTDMITPFRQTFGIPVGFDTDVNGAALGELRWGAGRGLQDILYLTIGTGIGGGALVNGQPLHGMLHPEMGHIVIPHDRIRDPFEGVCPFHGNCLEGLATGPAMQKRWGTPAQNLPPEHPAWALEAHYLALAVANFVLTLSPQRIILGGGVMSQAALFPMIRQHVRNTLNGYVQSPSILQEEIGEYIVPPALGGHAGVAGALVLAESALAAS